MATIKDVAKEARVAISTVSNVLNQVDVVKPETKEKVLEAVDKLNYTPNLNGKFLKQAKTRLLGLFITNVEGPFYNDLISAMYAQCCQNQYNLMIFLNNETNINDSYQAILGKRVDGAIILNNTIKESQVQTFQKLNMPVIFLDREEQSNTISSVVIDNYSGMKQATQYLIETGHQRIGYVHGHRDNYDEQMRYQGYVDTLEQNGLHIEEEWEIEGQFSKELAYQKIQQEIKIGKKLPDAFLCANDEMAIACIESLNDCGIRIPEDSSVIGFDNIEKTDYFVPKITTVDSASRELGKTAVEELLRILEGKPIRGVRKIPTKLVVRDSCKPRNKK